MLSRGWIRAAGHYYSQVAKETKEMIFPTDYDATKMFWLINRSGAHGARSDVLKRIAGTLRKGTTFRFNS
jgi:hypothetical protein